MPLINISDLKDPNDPEGRSYREVNNATEHSLEVGQLVEVEEGIRLLVVGHARDCDGTPLYHLGVERGYAVLWNHSIDSLSIIAQESE